MKYPFQAAAVAISSGVFAAAQAVNFGTVETNASGLVFHLVAVVAFVAHASTVSAFSSMAQGHSLSATSMAATACR